VILLDTNVVSEWMRPSPNQRVLRWTDAQATETLFLSSVSVAELEFGIGVLPQGRRRDALSLQLQEILAHFSGRVLAFDLGAAHHYTQLALIARNNGGGFLLPDAYIAAIAAANGFTVATRDTGPFEAAGATVINPWLA
jgi:toxin FitB